MGEQLAVKNLEIWDEFGELIAEKLLEAVKILLEKEWLDDDSKSEFDDLIKEELPDFSEVRKLVNSRLDEINKIGSIEFSVTLLSKLIEQYKILVPKDIIVYDDTKNIVIKTKEHNYVYFSVIELLRCWAVLPYVLTLQKYIFSLDSLLEKYYYTTRHDQNKKEQFKKLPDNHAVDILSSAGISDLLIKLESFFEEQNSYNRFLNFLKNPEWSGLSKKLDRQDLLVSSTVKAGRWLAVAADRRGEWSIALSKIPHIDELFTDLLRKNNEDMQALNERPLCGENVIWYGAPGTGKSHKVNSITEKSPFIRCVFHADLQNSDFFGCLKPRMNNGKVEYSFAEGPFMSALAMAYLKPKEMVYLIIEELNRAAAAAVFGDLFLLLDRDSAGASEYSVAFPSPESREWLTRKLEADLDALRLPSNLSIFATMNSADQGVFPLRYCLQATLAPRYIGLEYNRSPDGDVSLISKIGEVTLSWREFVQFLNGFLLKQGRLNLDEDRLIGPWFVKERDLQKSDVPKKVLLYLWDDLLRHEGRELLFISSIKTFGELETRNARKETIFQNFFYLI